MSMTTRCPSCGTAFKVVPDQLRVRNGLVRCGECATVFDGRASLVAQVPAGFDRAPAVALPPDDQAASEPAVLRGRSDFAKRDPYLSDSISSPSETDWDEADVTFDDEREGVGAADRIRGDAEDFHIPASSYRPAEASRGPDPTESIRVRRDEDDLYDTDPSEAGADEDRPTVVRGEARTRYHGATDVGRAPPEFLDTEHQARRSLWRSLIGHACVLGLLVLAAQAIYVYRTTIADMWPQMRPLLERACQSLGCDVGYARHIAQISITSSSLQPPVGQAAAFEQSGAKALVLRASLRNLYGQPQPWPALRLDLSDLSDTVVIRKVLLPDDYLPPGQAGQPFAAGAEFNLAVPIEVTGAHVNGFQLHKFFP